MPFVRRDAEGKINAVFHGPEEGANEEVPAGSEELLEFLKVDVMNIINNDEWIQADLSLARVTEDLIDILIENGTFSFTDLPEGAQMKLIKRQGLRSEMSYAESLFGSDEENYLGDDEGLL